MAKQKHGLHGSRLYRTWKSMKERCNNPNSKSYKRYGGRGITVCDEWQYDFLTFYYWAIENGYEENLQIERKNNDGNYDPNNCEWVTQKINARNRRDTQYLCINNEIKCVAE